MTLDAKATQARYNNAVKARDAVAKSYRQAKVASETCTDYVRGVLARVLPELSAAETAQRHEAAHCWDETEQAKELARQQKDVAKAMEEGKA